MKFYPSRKKSACEGTVNFGSDVNEDLVELTYAADGTAPEWTWTPYDDEATCENYGGFWYGSESGTDHNDKYDVGEYFIDRDASLTITDGSGGSSGAAAVVALF